LCASRSLIARPFMATPRQMLRVRGFLGDARVCWWWGFRQIDEMRSGCLCFGMLGIRCFSGGAKFWRFSRGKCSNGGKRDAIAHTKFICSVGQSWVGPDPGVPLYIPTRSLGMGRPDQLISCFSYFLFFVFYFLLLLNKHVFFYSVFSFS
jgi:hypothetical protein